MSVDPTKVRRTNYDVTWGAVDLGGLDSIDLSKLKEKFDPVKIGSLGAMKLDDRFIGLEDGASITIEVREVTRARINLLTGVHTGGTGTAKLDLVAPVNTLMSNTYGAVLILHPRDMGADVSQDLKFYKAVPVGPPISRDGMKDDVWKIEFMIYPDLSKLPSNPYGEYQASA